MKVAIHTKRKNDEQVKGQAELEKALCNHGIEVVDNWVPDKEIDMMISIGGDGTLLSAVHQIGRAEVPVVGINFGHLGFLTTAGKGDIEWLAECLRDGRYSIEHRTMLEVTVYSGDDIQWLSALNEVYLHRCQDGTLLHTQVEMDGEKVATYTGDGLIVATPTGSTAYSLSCGGPILAPGLGSLVITPIAAHTLTQRPVVVRDDVRMRLREEREGVPMTLGVDSFVCRLEWGSVIEICKADYSTRLVRLGEQNFFTAIREKLMWGV